MAVLIGSARSDEHGKAHGGAAGDQKGGREVSTQNWYRHEKGWRVFRAKDEKAAEKIAVCMELACASPLIGYDQYQRLTLYNAVRDKGFDVARLDRAVETDCSALVRVCCAYAGVMLENFTTPAQPSVMAKSGAFTEMVGSRYTDSSDYLKRGDVLVTRTQGHTVVVLTDGPKAGREAAGGAERMQLRKGHVGAQVIEMQNKLMAAGYALPKYGADGEFGAETDKALRAFQQAKGLEVDGICGPKTWAALDAAGKSGRTVRVTGGTVNVRDQPSTAGKILKIAKKGEAYPATGRVENGWFEISTDRGIGWISGKYAE